MLNDYRIPPLNGQPPKRVVIFLHGLGDSGAGGLLSIGQIWQRSFPDCEFLCPDAPFPLDNAPPGFEGRQWFSLQKFDPDYVLHGAQKASPILNDYIDHILKSRNLLSSQLVLVGFSQGTIMALYTAPRRDHAVAGIIGYSGLLIGGELLATEKKSIPPVLLVHGQMDNVVPFTAMTAAEQTLRRNGFDLQTLACPATDHTIDEAGLQAGLGFLRHVWPA